MKNTLLLVLLLHSGCEASTDVQGCLEGWFEITCRYSKGNGKNLQVSSPRGKINVPKDNRNEWMQWGKQISLYHSTSEKFWRVFVKQLTVNDFGDYECIWNTNKEEKDLENDGNKVCPNSIKTAYRGEQTNITCSQSGRKFICKENQSTCDTVSSAPFYTIRNVSGKDQGVYWCGYEPPSKRYRVSREKIELQVSTRNNKDPIITPTQSSHNTESAKFSTPPKNTDPIYTPQLNNPDTLWKIIVTAVVVCVIILLLAVAIFCLHKRFGFFTNSTAANKGENYYEEIQERPQQLGSGTVLKTIYATATLHTVKSGPNTTGNKTSTDATFKDNVLYMQQ